MHRNRVTRRIAAAVVSVALAGGIFAAAPLSADAKARPAKSNWSYSSSADIDLSYGDYAPTASSFANGV